MSFPVDCLEDLEDVGKVRNALWSDDALIDEFVSNNPSGLSLSDLELAKSWKHRVGGVFIVERHLKKHSIFIGEDDKVYGVEGLVTPLPVLIPNVPTFLKTFLIPFEDRIIYDGLVNSYPITFGRNSRGGFKDTYVRAKKANQIIDSFAYPPLSKAKPKRLALV